MQGSLGSENQERQGAIDKLISKLRIAANTLTDLVIKEREDRAFIGWMM